VADVRRAPPRAGLATAMGEIFDGFDELAQDQFRIP
jgi:hypothetical protein